MEPAFVSILQAGEFLGFRRSSIYKLLNEGKLQSTRLGNRRLIAVESLEAFAAKLMEAV